MIFQDSASSLDPRMTVCDSITEPMCIHRIAPPRGTYRKEAEFQMYYVGLDKTYLDKYPSELSGGQRQRLAMARALLHDSPIYVFDEATSNVDAESENDIMQAIHSLAGKKAIILISHRLANVVHSDCIYAMSNGRVIEQGTHAELLAKQGAYSRLYLAQQQLETLEEEDA